MRGVILRKIVWFGSAFTNILKEELRKISIEADEFQESGPKKGLGRGVRVVLSLIKDCRHEKMRSRCMFRSRGQ